MMTRNEFFDYVKDNVKKYLPPAPRALKPNVSNTKPA